MSAQLTASQVLIDALTEFGESEGRAVLLVFSNDQGDLCFRSNASNTLALGLAEFAKQAITRTIFSQGGK